MRDRIFISSPTMHGEELLYIQEALERNWVAPLGFNCDGFETEILQYLCREKPKSCQALALSSCTSALHLAVKLAGIQPGDIVLCSDLTFVASANAISYEGGIQVFVDAERDTWNMDPRALELAFQKYPTAKAVLLTHLYGVPAQMRKIQEICKRHGAVLIEDAAEALGASCQGKSCGTLGDLGAISFNGNKIITTSGGGMLITHDSEDREKALYWATQSREAVRWYQHRETGYNYRMSNIAAGIGRGQLKYLNEHCRRKAEIYETYRQGLEDLPVQMNPYLPDSKPNFWLSCLTVNGDCVVTPERILEVLDQWNIEARPIWKPMHLQPLFADRDFIRAEAVAVDEDIFRRGLCLPSDIKMTRREQELVMDVIRSCFEEQYV